MSYSIMTTHVFVGPDGKAYSENKPEEGGFLSYFDGCKWLITFPIDNGFARRCYFFFGDRLPASAKDWEIRCLSANDTFPAFVESR